MNFKPRDIVKVICSSVSCEFDRFLICWLRDLMLFRKRFFSLIFLGSILLRHLTPLLSQFCFFSLLPLFLKGQRRQQDKIHFFYCLPGLCSHLFQQCIDLSNLSFQHFGQLILVLIFARISVSSRHFFLYRLPSFCTCSKTK